MRNSTTLVLMYVKPRHVIRNGDFSLLGIKSWDVTPCGLVGRPKQFQGTCYPLVRVQEFFPSNPEDGNASFHQYIGTYVSDTTASHTMNPYLNTFYAENTCHMHFVSCYSSS